MVNGLFVDGPQDGRVFRNQAWMGLSVLFPVPPEISVIPLAEGVMPPFPKSAVYNYWGRLGNTVVYKFNGVH